MPPKQSSRSSSQGGASPCLSPHRHPTHCLSSIASVTSAHAGCPQLQGPGGWCPEWTVIPYGAPFPVDSKVGSPNTDNWPLPGVHLLATNFHRPLSVPLLTLPWAPGTELALSLGSAFLSHHSSLERCSPLSPRTLTSAQAHTSVFCSFRCSQREASEGHLSITAATLNSLQWFPITTGAGGSCSKP